MGLTEGVTKEEGEDVEVLESLWKDTTYIFGMLPPVGSCSCRSVTTMVCLSQVCTWLRSAVKMWHRDLYLVSHCQGNPELCWWYASVSGEGKGSCCLWSLWKLIFRAQMEQEGLQALKVSFRASVYRDLKLNRIKAHGSKSGFNIASW